MEAVRSAVTARLLSSSACGEIAGQGWSHRGESNPGPAHYEQTASGLLWGSTRDNICRSHTFGCSSGTVGPEFAPRLIPRRTVAAALGDQATDAGASCTISSAPSERGSRSAEFSPERLSRPGGAAAAEEVMIAGQDGGVEDEGERHRRPVAGIARNPPTGHRLPVLIEAARDDLDQPLGDESEHIVVQALGVVVIESSLFDDHSACRRRTSNICASSSSYRPVSSRT